MQAAQGGEGQPQTGAHLRLLHICTFARSLGVRLIAKASPEFGPVPVSVTIGNGPKGSSVRRLVLSIPRGSLRPPARHPANGPQRVREDRRPGLRAHGARQVRCSAFSGGQLVLAAAGITHNGDGASRPAPVEPAQRPAERLCRIVGGEDYQGHSTGGGIEEHVLGPQVGDEAPGILF